MPAPCPSMAAPLSVLAATLAADHKVVVPDLRGMGLSAHPEAGYTKKNEAADVIGALAALKTQYALPQESHLRAA